MQSFDVTDLKILVKTKRIAVVIDGGNILVHDAYTGERVRIGSFEPVVADEKKGCDLCLDADGPITAHWYTEDPQGLTSTPHQEAAHFCPRCGRQLMFAAAAKKDAD